MGQEQHVEIGLDTDLRDRISSLFIHEGALFGAVPQSALTDDEMLQLTQAGWIRRDYHDAPVFEAPQSTIDWLDLKQQHRDRALHAISHRLADGAPWVGTRQEILEELLASTWEQQEEELRTLLHAFAFASMWSHDQDANDLAIESRETFFFYTGRMQEAAQQASRYATEPPASEHEFWDMVSSLSERPH